MKKTFPIELSEDLHREMKHASIDDGVTLHDWILDTLKEKLSRKRNGKSSKRSTNANNRTAAS
jgi:hypothetical protein